ncbi:MAG: universal stress protein [Legionellales bacterium]|nr:universal stress protein [Legionellales bacterium]
MSYKHILIATDLSNITDKLLKKGSQLGWLFEAKISLLHVVSQIPVYGYADGSVIRIENELVNQATDEVNKIGKQFNIPAEDTYVKIGSVIDIILEFAKENSVDLILIGSHGRSGLRRLLGSCASSIVHGTNLDVFIVHYGETN